VLWFYTLLSKQGYEYATFTAAVRGLADEYSLCVITDEPLDSIPPERLTVLRQTNIFVM
jgi:hypothetical protein